MSDINVTVQDEIVNIDILDTPVLVNVVNSPGVPGAPGQGVPVGGTTGQVLAKSSATNYDTAWVNVTGGAWGTITGTLSNQTDLQNALNAKVPYTGATANVNLGEYEIKAGQVTLDTSPTGTAAVGTTRWNDTLGSTETTLKGGSVILKNGVDLVARVVNKVSPNTTLTKAAYQAVRVSGAQGQRLAVAFAQANNDNNSADTIGLVTETIATNQEGFIITVGQLENINTTGSLQGETWADGDVLYLSPTTAGALTNVKPTGATGHIVVIGYVEYAHAVNGKIYVKVTNGWELDELHNLNIVSPTNNQSIFYNSSNQLWENKSIATALGYTPANAATTLTINGVTYDLSANRSWTVAGGISGSGAAGQVAYWDGTTSQAGSNNLFWDSNNVILGNDKGIVLQTAGTNRNILIKAGVVTDNFSTVAFYPNSGTNVTSSLNLIPRGTGYSATIKSQINVFNTDFVADINNYEFAAFRAGGATFTLATGKAGTGTIRPLLLSSGFLDGTTNANQLWLYTNGNVGINTTTNGTERLQVQGTTLLNGNVTFSSATGMFWDATNSRLGIGTNAPIELLEIRSNANLGNGFGVINLNAGSGAQAQSYMQSNSGYLFMGKRSSAFATFKNITSGAAFLYSTSTDFALLAENGKMTFLSGSGSTAHMTLQTTGNLSLGSTTDSGERLQVTGDVKFGSAFKWDNTNARLGIGTTTPVVALHVNGDATYRGTYPYFELVPSGWSGGKFYIQGGTDAQGQNAGSYTVLLNTQTSRGFSFVYGNASVMALAPTTANLLIGTTSDISSSLVTMNSTTKGFLPPRMTTTQKNAISSPAAGLVVYDTTLAKLCVYTTAWETITSV